jgi:hypothetical protein
LSEDENLEEAPRDYEGENFVQSVIYYIKLFSNIFTKVFHFFKIPENLVWLLQQLSLNPSDNSQFNYCAPLIAHFLLCIHNINDINIAIQILQENLELRSFVHRDILHVFGFGSVPRELLEWQSRHLFTRRPLQTPECLEFNGLARFFDERVAAEVLGRTASSLPDLSTLQQAGTSQHLPLGQQRSSLSEPGTLQQKGPSTSQTQSQIRRPSSDTDSSASEPSEKWKTPSKTLFKRRSKRKYHDKHSLLEPQRKKCRSLLQNPNCSSSNFDPLYVEEPNDPWLQRETLNAANELNLNYLAIEISENFRFSYTRSNQTYREDITNWTVDFLNLNPQLINQSNEILNDLTVSIRNAVLRFPSLTTFEQTSLIAFLHRINGQTNWFLAFDLMASDSPGSDED